MVSSGKSLDRGLEWVLVLAVGLCTSLSFGLDFPAYNQNQYLLQGLQWLDPTLFVRDWFTTGTTQYHTSFSWIVWLAAQTGHLGWALTLLNSVLICIAVVLVYSIVRQTAAAEALWVTVLVASLMVVTRTFSFAYTYLFESYTQPSGIAAFFLIAAVALFVGGRYLASGIALAVAGFMHLNFLVLGGLFFGIAHLALGLQGVIGRGLRQFLVLIPVVLWGLPTLLAAASPELAHEAREIYFNVRVPHHYLPSEYWPAMIPFAGWQLLALACVRLVDDGSSAAAHRMGVLYASGLMLIALLHQATSWVFIDSIALLFVSRLAPLVTLLAQIIIGIAMTGLIAGRIDRQRLRAEPWRVTTMVVGLAIVLGGFYVASSQYRAESVGFVVALLTLPAALVVGLLVRQPPFAFLGAYRAPLQAMVFLAAFAAIFMGAGTIRLRNSLLLNGNPDSQAVALYAWAASTPQDSIFLIPPQLEDFRIQASRAVVVDWKSVPGLPAEILAWHRRLVDISGMQQFSEKSIRAGYAAMDEARAQLLRERYGAAFVVLERSATRAYPWCREVFGNGRYVVCSLAPS